MNPTANQQFKTYFLLLLLLLGLAACGQDPQFRASASKEEFTLDETIYISYTIFANGKDFEPPSFAGFQVISDPNPTGSYASRKEDGIIKTSISYGYRIKAKKVGEFTIEPAKIRVNGKILTSKSLNIKVTPSIPIVIKPLSDKDMFLKTELSKDSVSIGEPIIAICKIYYKRSFACIAQPKFHIGNGFRLEDFSIDPQFKPPTEEIDGVEYSIFILKRTILYPLESGVFYLGPMEQEMGFQLGSKGRREKADKEGHKDFFRPRYDTTIVFKSNEVTVNVDSQKAEFRDRLTKSDSVYLLQNSRTPSPVKIFEPPYFEKVKFVLAVDISLSMLAQDFKPNRLEAAKNVVRKFIETRSGDSLGLIAFEYMGTTKSKLSLDHVTLKDSVQKLTCTKADLGTSLGRGLHKAIELFMFENTSRKVIILITDGENNGSVPPPLSVADFAKFHYIKIYTIGMSSDVEAMYPYKIENDKISYKMIETKIDEDLLTKIADTTGGKYFRAFDEKGLAEIFDQINKLEQ